MYLIAGITLISLIRFRYHDNIMYMNVQRNLAIYPRDVIFYFLLSRSVCNCFNKTVDSTYNVMVKVHVTRFHFGKKKFAFNIFTT